MKKQNEPTVLIHLSGGNVESVTTDTPLRVVVLDYDAGDVGEGNVDVPKGKGETDSAAVLTPELEVNPRRAVELLSVVAEQV